ncbi:MAG: hypothetical protein ABFS21_10600 [Actinomycetota bacterium]
MTAHKRTIVFVLVVVLMLAAVPAATAGSSTERPIQEHLIGHGTGMDDSQPGTTYDGRCSKDALWVSSMAGTGVVSHLGNVTWTTSHCFYPDYSFGDAVLVITAANGDKLLGTYSGYMTGMYSMVDTMTITGGTGRFANASGVISEHGTFDPDTFALEVTGKGWISYDASDRAKA